MMSFLLRRRYPLLIGVSVTFLSLKFRKSAFANDKIIFNTSTDPNKDLVAQRLDRVASGLKQKIEDVLKSFPQFSNPSLLEEDQKKRKEKASDEILPSLIDHTVLKPTATNLEIKKMCDEALHHHFKAVCVNGSNVVTAQEFCHTSSPEHKVEIAAVVGFPLGAMTKEAKAYETKHLIDIGVDEIDMVINMGRLKDSDYDYVLKDIQGVVKEAHQKKKIVKVILECGALTKEEIADGSILSILAGADFIKTSTGFGFGGAKEEDVRLMKLIAGPDHLVKASGGVRSKKDAIIMFLAGADRIGTSSGVQIVSDTSTAEKKDY